MPVTMEECVATGAWTTGTNQSIYTHRQWQEMFSDKISIVG